MLYIGDMDH